MFHWFKHHLLLPVLVITTALGVRAQQCPDTYPKITGPDVVGASTNSVKYTTPYITGHTYNWVVYLEPSTVVGGSTTNELYQVFSTPGNYRIELTEGISGNTCTPVSVTPLSVLVKPMLAAHLYYEFDAVHRCFYNEVYFAGTGDGHYPAQDASVSYSWKWRVYNPSSPGAWLTTSITPFRPDSVMIAFPSTPGVTYEVNLKVSKTIAGTLWEDDITDYVYVDPDKYRPVAVLATPTTPLCLNQAFHFSAEGSMATFMPTSETITEIIWDFGDGTGDTATSPWPSIPPVPLTIDHIYSSPASGLVVTLKLVNSKGCDITKTITIDVPNTIPVANFSYAQTCVNEAAPFTDASLPSTGNITDWWWFWDDGSPTTYYSTSGTLPPAIVYHTFTDLATHFVTLKVRNSNGCINTTPAIAIAAQPSPEANFTFPTTICSGDVVHFTDMSSALTGTPIGTWAWDFGDPTSPNNTSGDPSPTHLFSGPGNYIVTLTVTNQAGCANTKTLTSPLVVNPHPDIDFSIVQGTAAYMQVFTAQVNPAQNVGNNVYWTFGDGTGGFGSPITHNYPGPGTYTAACQAIDMVTGCTTTVTHEVSMGAPPSPCFTANPPNQCQHVPILFVPCPPGGLITTEVWYFGDGDSAVFVTPNVPASPNHAYNGPGQYHVTRILNRGTTMETTWDLWVTIFEAPAAHFTWFSDSTHMHQGQACDGMPVYFDDQSYSNSTPPGTIYQWLWNFDDPLSGPNNTSPLENPVHTFTPLASGGKTTYNVTLQVWDNYQNCPSLVDTIPVTINDPIPVEFTYNNNVCQDQTVNFTTDPLVLPPSNYTWSWNFGDGFSSTSPGSVSHMYVSVGNYNVTLLLTDVNGCQKAITHTVTIIPKPVANFSFTSPTCFGQSVQFTDLSFVPLPYNDVVVAWHWDFGDGDTSNLQNPSHTYAVFNATGYNVTLTVTTNRGCSQTKTINVLQVASPAAEFEVAAGTPACMTPQSVQFTDLSQTNGGGNILYWNWDFGDLSSGASNFSTTQHPSHTYTSSGNKLVTLVVTNSNGCRDTIQHSILINALPVPNFTTSATCAGQDMQFTNTSTTTLGSTIVSYNWNFGDGGSSTLPSPSHPYANYGIYNVTLTIVNTNGCTNTITKPVLVNPKPVPNFTFTAGSCIGNPVTFTDLSFIPAGYSGYDTTWTWDFNDGTPRQTIYYPNSPNVTHTFAGTSSVHQVKLIVTTTNGCTDSITKTVNSIPSPIANFSYSNTTCLGQDVQFNDLTQTNGGGSIQNWNWNFGDPVSGANNTSTSPSPIHSFTAPGTFQVILKVTSTNGCIDYDTVQVEIDSLPAANFTYAQACEGKATQFTDSSIPHASTIISYSWNFGDGGTSSLQSPTHVYGAFGDYLVTLTVVNSNGCIHSITKQVTVYPRPVPNFTFSPASCVGLPVSFNSTSFVPSSTSSSYISTWVWTWGDGSDTTIYFPGNPNVNHTFAGNSSVHFVQLKVITTTGCTDSITKTVTSIPSPQANFSYSNTTCLGQMVNFTDLTQTNGGGTIQTWNWQFGDPLSGASNSSTLQHPSHSFTHAGDFSVTLTVTSSNGCTNTYSPALPITIHALPVAAFTADTVCQGSPTTFNNTSTTPPNTTPPAPTTFIAYAWDFGDGGTSAQQSPQHIFSNYGYYTVSLTVTNSNGCINDTSRLVMVDPKPIADFSFSATTCVGNPVNFTNQSFVPSGYSSSIRIWHWVWGDGTDTTIVFPGNPNVTHTFVGTSTTHQVTLTVTTTAGCTATISKTVTSVPSPIANFSYSSTLCDNQPVQFTDLSQTNGGGSIQTWNWNFGDPASGMNNVATNPNPIHQFSANGSFTVTLMVTNGNGCYKSIDTLLNIGQRPVANFEADTACQGSLTTFTSLSSGGTISSYLWDFGDGQTSTSSAPTHLYAIPTVYNVHLTVTNSLGCQRDTIKQVLVLGKPVPLFSYQSPNCAGDSVQFFDQSTTPHGSIKQWEWDFGDGNTSGPILFPANQNVRHLYANGGTYNVKLTILTTDNCTAEKITPVMIGARPLANFSFGNAPCALTPLQFNDLSQQNSGPAITTWSWNFGDPGSGTNNTSTTQNPTHMFSTGGPFIVRLMVTNANGCSDSVVGGKQVNVNPAPFADFAADTSCLGSPTVFTDASTGTPVSWTWDFGDPSSGTNNSSTLQNPTHTYNLQGTYNVHLTVANASQCENDTVIQVSVNPSPEAMFQYETACAGDSTQFTDLSLAPGSGINNWNWDFGDGGTAVSQDPKHKFATAGTYQVTLIVKNLTNCTDTVSMPVIVRPKPAAHFTYTAHFCPAGLVNFQDISTASGTNIASRLWTFEPGFSSTIPNPTHAFTVTDTTFMVDLMITDGYGCMDTITDSVHVKPGFEFTFINNDTCQGFPTRFYPVNPNHAAGDSLYSVSWNFGDPGSGPANNSVLFRPLHTFSGPATYVVKMKAYNTDNCVDSVYKNVVVFAAPEAWFHYRTVACNDTIFFSDSTQFTGSGGIASFEWRFGDGGTSTLQNPSHAYAQPGIYHVTMIITNVNGCIDSVMRTVQRFPCIAAGFTHSDTLCARNIIAFSDTSLPVSLINQWHWFWGDGHDTVYTSHHSPITHYYADSGRYQVKLRIQALVDGTTVTDSIIRLVKVNPTPLVAFSNVPVCMNQPTLFRDTSKIFGATISRWQWNFGAGPADTSNLKNPDFVFDTAGYYDVRLIMTNKFGCRDSLTKSTRVYGLPVARYENTAACTEDPTYFTDLTRIADTTIGYWHWSFGDPSTLKDTSLVQNPSYRYPDTVTYSVSLIVKDRFGCFDTYDSTLKVHITPVSSFTVTKDYNGKQGQVKMNNLSTGATGYKWEFGNGKTSTDENPVALFTEDDTYTIKLISLNKYECSDTTYYRYELLFKGLYVPNAFSPSGTNLGVRLFQPVGINLKQYHVAVFDIWGHQLWESTKLDDKGSPVEGWDGTFEGVLMPQGNYMWKIKALFVDDTQWEGSDIGVGGTGKTMGTVTLIR